MATVNSATSSGSGSALSAKTGIGGLVSGMDIDALVESLSSTSRNKIIKQQQNVQKYQWKQVAYRTVSTALKEFQAKYLDTLSKTNFRSQSFYKTVSATSTSSAATASATASAFSGSITINSITDLATNQSFSSKSGVSKALSGTIASLVPDVMTDTDVQTLVGKLTGKSILLTLDGQTKTIAFDETFAAGATTPATLESSLQGLVDAAFGVTNGVNRVATVDITGTTLSFSAPGSTLRVNALGDDTATLTELGLTSNQSNKLSLTASVATAGLLTEPTAGVDVFQFKINSVDFSFSKSDSISTIINKVNSSNAGVNLSYSSISDKFVMTAKETGAGDRIVLSESAGNLLTAFGLTTAADATRVDGQNAVLSVNGQTIIRSSNDVLIDGIQLTLKEETATEFKINAVSDPSTLMEPIKAFVADYNALIESMNKSLKENVNKDYPPLTEKQKEEMSETQIKAWEEKAKSGLLSGDTLVRGIVSKIQADMAGLSINGVSLYSMGITSAGYAENGKLKIDETKLTEALKSNASGISELFTSEKGLGNALNNTIQNAIKTSGPKGARGSLTEAAGVASSTSDTENRLTDKINQTNKTIERMKIRLEAEETRLWSRFTAMEKAISQLNNQSSYISQFSSN